MKKPTKSPTFANADEYYAFVQKYHVLGDEAIKLKEQMNKQAQMLVPKIRPPHLTNTR